MCARARARALECVRHLMSTPSRARAHKRARTQQLHIKKVIISSRSGWRLLTLLSVNLEFLKVAPVKYGSRKFLNPNLIPKKLQKHLINVQGEDDEVDEGKCLLYSVSSFFMKISQCSTLMNAIF